MHQVIASEYYARGEDSRGEKFIVDAGVSCTISEIVYPALYPHGLPTNNRITSARRSSNSPLIAFIHFHLLLPYEMDVVTVDFFEIVYSGRNSFPRDCERRYVQGSFDREMRRECDIRRRRTNESTSPRRRKGILKTPS